MCGGCLCAGVCGGCLCACVCVIEFLSVRVRMCVDVHMFLDIKLQKNTVKCTCTENTVLDEVRTIIKT